MEKVELLFISLLSCDRLFRLRRLRLNLFIILSLDRLVVYIIVETLGDDRSLRVADTLAIELPLPNPC